MNTQTIHRVTHEIKRRRLQVLRVVDITPRMRRVTLGGPELAGFVSLGSDDHISCCSRRTPKSKRRWKARASASRATARNRRCATTRHGVTT